MHLPSRLLGSHLSEQWALLSATWHEAKMVTVRLGSIFTSLSPRMQTWYLWWAVQYAMPILWPVIPLSPCDGKVWLSTRTRRSQLWSRFQFWTSALQIIIHLHSFLCWLAITSNNNILQIALQDTMAKCVLKYVITVPIILHATLVMGIVNVCLAGQQVTAQNVSFCPGRLPNN